MIGCDEVSLAKVNVHHFDSIAVVDALKFFLHESGKYDVDVDHSDVFFIQDDALTHATKAPIEMEDMHLANNTTVHLVGVTDIFDRMAVHFSTI